MSPAAKLDGWFLARECSISKKLLGLSKASWLIEGHM